MLQKKERYNIAIVGATGAVGPPDDLLFLRIEIFQLPS